jgi:hypothetical protein
MMNLLPCGQQACEGNAYCGGKQRLIGGETANQAGRNQGNLGGYAWVFGWLSTVSD